MSPGSAVRRPQSCHTEWGDFTGRLRTNASIRAAAWYHSLLVPLWPSPKPRLKRLRKSPMRCRSERLTARCGEPDNVFSPSEAVSWFRGAKGHRGLKRPATQTLIGSGVTEGWRLQARKPGMAVEPAYSATAFRLIPRSLTSISLPAFRER
jgi:hypothetical protein